MAPRSAARSAALAVLKGALPDEGAVGYPPHRGDGYGLEGVPGIGEDAVEGLRARGQRLPRARLPKFPRDAPGPRAAGEADHDGPARGAERDGERVALRVGKDAGEPAAMVTPLAGAPDDSSPAVGEGLALQADVDVWEAGALP